MHDKTDTREGQIEHHMDSTTPTTDRLARDGWSGDAACVSGREMGEMEIRFRALINAVRTMHVDGDGLTPGCSVCDAIKEAEKWLNAPSDPSGNVSDGARGVATQKEVI